MCECLALEQYYIDKYKPRYNILKVAGSSIGFKHNKHTIEKLQKMHSGKLHPRYDTKPSVDQKLLFSKLLNKYYANHPHHMAWYD